jgi:hypothetical protein
MPTPAGQSPALVLTHEILHTSFELISSKGMKGVVREPVHVHPHLQGMGDVEAALGLRYVPFVCQTDLVLGEC